MLYTKTLELKESLLWWQEMGKQYTASGYGAKIPTSYMVRTDADGGKRWRRVYCMCYSNSGSFYVLVNGKRAWLDELELETMRDEMKNQKKVKK